ncbi:MAG: hypothetical protein KF706_02545 [Chitinophagales bacterium]|nr:hypothetical protein [Chitinophagales bacterium]
MKILASLFLLFSIPIFAQQQTEYHLLSSVSSDATIATIDKFGNYYLASPHKLFKYSSDGKMLYPYEEFRYGSIGSIDVTNPLKIVVYFPDMMKAVILDRFLSPLVTYDFLQLDYSSVGAVCGSTDGRIWFYDIAALKLKKIDETGTILRESQSLNNVLNTIPAPNFLLEYDNRVFMNDSSLGILVFDIFGSYQKTIPILGLTKFQLTERNIIYADNQKLYSYNMLSLATVALTALPEENFSQAVFGKNSLLLIKDGKALFYSF